MDEMKYNAGRHVIHRGDVEDAYRTIDFIKTLDRDRVAAITETLGGSYFDHFAPSAKCGFCDCYMKARLVDGIPTYSVGVTALKQGFTDDFCPGHDLVDKGVLEAEIEVPSGTLVFVNFFRSKEFDVPENEQWDAKYSLNTIFGRNNIMQFHAQQNVGYGQMGNMSIDIYTKKGKPSDTVLIGMPVDWIDDTSAPDHVTRIAQFDGFESRGRISLSMWRWMCMDKDQYTSSGEQMKDHYDVVEVKVIPGRYRIEHWYDFHRDDTDIYSKLTKVG